MEILLAPLYVSQLWAAPVGAQRDLYLLLVPRLPEYICPRGGNGKQSLMQSEAAHWIEVRRNWGVGPCVDCPWDPTPVLVRDHPIMYERRGGQLGHGSPGWLNCQPGWPGSKELVNNIQNTISKRTNQHYLHDFSIRPKIGGRKKPVKERVLGHVILSIMYSRALIRRSLSEGMKIRAGKKYYLIPVDMTRSIPPNIDKVVFIVREYDVSGPRIWFDEWRGVDGHRNRRIHWSCCSTQMQYFAKIGYVSRDWLSFKISIKCWSPGGHQPLHQFYVIHMTLRQEFSEETKMPPKTHRARGRTPDQEDERRLRKIIEAAFRNPRQWTQPIESQYINIGYHPDVVSWDAEQFHAARNKSHKKFPPLSSRLIDKPATIVDCKGRIILWYLPGFLLPARQVRVLCHDY